MVQSRPISESSKRKAEDDILNPKVKTIKNNSEQFDQAPIPPSKIIISNGKPSMSQQVPYRGTSKVTVSSTPSPALVSEPSKQPKKGSFKEIMARAQAAAAQPKAPVGTISHKPKEKMEISYKKEQKMKKKALRDKKLGIVRNDSRPSSSDGHRSSPTPGTDPNKKKAPQPAYTGTAKPKSMPAYRGTMGAVDGRKPSAKVPPKRRANEYAATDDELDSEEEDEDDGYGYSDAESDDMEAGFSDVEQEESQALKAARKEDEEEAKLEAKLKQEKDERRKRLEMMAKRAKPQRY